MLTVGPGLHDGIDEQDYHADRVLAPEHGHSLSQSAAKTLRRSPRRYLHERTVGRRDKDAFDLGGTVHSIALRSNDSRIRVIDAYDWRSKAAQEAKAAARKDRLTAIHRGQLLQASRIARAVHRDELAGAILSEGRPEVTAYAIDPDTGVALRARFDWLREGTSHDCLVDLKTADYGRGTEDVFGSSAASYDYPMQAWWYRHVYHLITGVWLPFYTITVETEPPYFVTVGQYDEADLRVGEERAREAITAFAEGESNDWATEPQIVTFNLPGWYGRTA